MAAQEIFDGKCISGNYYNLAAFLPSRFHATVESVDTLARLAAYSIRVAQEIDPQYVDGLDVAVYRDSEGRFEFENADNYWNLCEEIEREMRECFRRAVPQSSRRDP